GIGALDPTLGPALGGGCGRRGGLGPRHRAVGAETVRARGEEQERGHRGGGEDLGAKGRGAGLHAYHSRMGGVTNHRRRRPNRRRSGGGLLLSDRAVSTARAAIEDMDEGPACDHRGANVTHPGVVVHSFAADLPGYRGWEWHVVLASAPGTQHITVSEVALVAGDSALQAPKWVPWEERVRPGDLGPRDLLPPAADDPRLTAGESGQRELSDAGIRGTSARWRAGDTGPKSEFAKE